MFCATFIFQTRSRACLKNHSRNLHAPLCGRFCPNSVAVARYGAFIRTKSPTNCDAHLAESLFQTRSRANIKRPTEKIEACKKARTISPPILCRHCKFFHTAAGITQENPSRLPHSFLIFPIRKTSLFRFQI